MREDFHFYPKRMGRTIIAFSAGKWGDQMCIWEETPILWRMSWTGTRVHEMRSFRR